MITIEQATAAVQEFDALTYFDRVSGPARLRFAGMLMAMVNWPKEKIVRNGYGPIAYVEPKDRLEWLLGAMLQGQYDEWPGLQEVRGVYCSRYLPADGIMADAQNVRYAPSEDPVVPQEPKYLPQPGDEPIGEDFQNQLSAAAKRLTAGGKK